MKLTPEAIKRLHQKYAPSEAMLEVVTMHCKVVADIALSCAKQLDEPVDTELLEQACLIHDVGSYAFLGRPDKDFNYFVYQQHALLGASILEDEGVDERVVAMVRNHLWLGLTKQDIQEYGLKLPNRDYLPVTIESELLNYADEFHSKDPKFKRFETQHATLARQAPRQAEKLRACKEKFGLPDLETLAKQYKQPLV